MTDVMIDIETLSTQSNALILTIGAVKFNRTTELPSLENCETFYKRINIESCKVLGMHIDPSTENWWSIQDKKTRYEAIENPDRYPIKDVLKEFSKWYKGSKYIWGHGDDFDCVILTNAYKACKMKVPWQFWNTRDTRTIFDIAGIHVNDVPVTEAHHALHDAYRQVKCLILSLDRLGCSD
jgi:DNA polymerase III epsilon subunit-like protein